MSDIRVSVQWKSAAVFAGESVDCIITLKNVAQRRRRSPSPNFLRGPGVGSSRERWKDSLPSQTAAPRASSGGGGKMSRRGSEIATAATPATIQEHRSHLQANNIRKGSASSLRQQQGLPDLGEDGTSKESKRRSVSIMSIGSNVLEELASPPMLSSKIKGPSSAHSRAASMQMLPRRNGSMAGISPTSGPGYDRAFSVPSPLIPQSPAFGAQAPAMARSRSQTNSISKSSLTVDTKKLPTRTVSGKSKGSRGADSSGHRKVDVTRRPGGNVLSRQSSTYGEGVDALNPASKILSPSSRGGTPRSSGEFYSMSNNSTETLASEYPIPQLSSGVLMSGHSRQSSVNPSPVVSSPEVIMMGYGQITGFCTLDGSLINQGPFEDVKRKTIIGGRGGGGVVRSASTKKDSGLLGSFGWGNIGDSLGGLLGGNEVSSLKEDKKSSGSRNIPLLSTPQSILFVDLRLGPGESKSFTFSHPVPAGLPPTHKGKAMKITYNLVIGTQRAPDAVNTKNVQRIELPFKVLTGVNGNGEILGHDLMSPHTILSNQSITQPIDSDSWTAMVQKGEFWPPSKQKTKSSAEDFSIYVEKLLAEGARNPNQELLSPTAEDGKMKLPGTADHLDSMKELINLAVLQSNATTASGQSANRFEIKRAGKRVAVIMLARPAFRLGETVPAVVDFADAEVPCYSLHSTLESRETVDPTVALRSKASIQRATRRVFASSHESTISATRVFFSPAIPAAAVPEFLTSTIALEWGLRFEFVTKRQVVGEEEGIDESNFDGQDGGEEGKGDSDGGGYSRTDDHQNERVTLKGPNQSQDQDRNLSTQKPTANSNDTKPIDPDVDVDEDDDDDDGLLEEVQKDERGTVRAAVQGLLCETFDVTVPIRVYGAVGPLDEGSMTGEYRI